MSKTTKTSARAILAKYERPGGKNYLNENIFNQGGIQVTYIDYNDPVYHQLWGEFISKLSILDLLMNEGQHSFNILMTGAVAQTRV